MTYPTILYWFNDTSGKPLLELSQPDSLRLLNKAVPSLRYLARSDCAKYYEYNDPSAITQELIKKHILKHYEYDAVDISIIMHELDKYVAEHQTGGRTD
jgi:hypothetical protein